MGYDCTLHLIDETAIRDQFVPRLLKRSRTPTPLDRVMANAGRLWTDVRRALAGDDPDAASLVCQLAVSFSACSLPHQYERGFALSLWGEQGERVAVDFPADLAFSPEPLFADVVAAYPRLSGRFPTRFTGNFSTGVYIPAGRVPDVLPWVEGRVANFAKGDRRRFKGLLGILRAAADRGLAYWEATDLAVPMANEFPGDPRLMLARYLGNEPATPGRTVERAPAAGHFNRYDCRVHGHWLVSADFGAHFETSFWDLSVWPPRLTHTLPEFAPYQCRSRAGRWLLFSETDRDASPRTFRPRSLPDPGAEPDGTVPVVIGGREMTIRHGGFVGDRPLVFRETSHTAKVDDPLPPPLWLAGQTWRPVPGVPAGVARRSAHPQLLAHPLAAVVHLADGGDVVVWDGDGYERRGRRFERTFALGPADGYEWTAVPAGPDGFFYLSDGRLFEARRGKEPVPHARRVVNVRSVRPGPAGGLVLQQGDNPDGDVAKLYFPADGTFSHIEPELFDDGDYPFVHWSPTTDRLIVKAGPFLAVSTADVLALPRYRVSTGRRAKS